MRAHFLGTTLAANENMCRSSLSVNTLKVISYLYFLLDHCPITYYRFDSQLPYTPSNLKQYNIQYGNTTILLYRLSQLNGPTFTKKIKSNKYFAVASITVHFKYESERLI